jgi:hypothetical protein
MIKNIKWLLLASIAIVSCSKDSEAIVEPLTPAPVVAGTANFAKFVSLGNSLTAGFSDGALFKKGQEGSYTNLMAEQFKLVGGGAFKIPFMNDNKGGLLFGGNPFPPDPTQFAPRLTILGVLNNGTTLVNTPNITLAAPQGTQTTEAGNNIFAASGPFNNMGVPGAKSFHLGFPGYGAFNPYFGRFASGASATIVGDAMAQAPTFFSLWIGNNDVLSYALSGGTGVNQLGNTNPGTYGGNDITDPTAFAGVYSGLVNALTAGGAKGVIANIPYVSTIPQFTTVPFNPLTAKSLGGSDAAVGIVTIRALNTGLYGPLKQILTAAGAANRINLLSETAANPVLIRDESLPSKATEIETAFTPSLGAATAAAFGGIFGQARQATKADLLLLNTQRVIGTINSAVPASINRFGVSFPLPDKDVLTATEVAELKTATDAYNVTIKALAESKGLAFVDANALLSRVANGGIRFGSYHLSSSYVVGGAFSYDGVHPAPQGYALIANEFLKAINLKYGSTFRGYDITNFPIQYPAVLPN